MSVHPRLHPHPRFCSSSRCHRLRRLLPIPPTATHSLPASPLPLLLSLPPSPPTVTMAFIAAPLVTRAGGRRQPAAAPTAATPAAATRPSMATVPPSQGAAVRSAAAAAVLALALGVGMPTAAHAVLPAPKLPPIDKTDKTRYVGGDIGAWRSGLRGGGELEGEG